MTADAEKLSVEDVFRKLGSTPDGQSAGEAARRLEKYGYNEIEEKKVNPWRSSWDTFGGPYPG